MKSWAFFDELLSKANVICTPGSGFGACGEGYVRFTSFNTNENTTEAMRRIKEIYEEGTGFSEHLDDKTTYKVVLVDRGSFIAEEDGKYRLITSPAAIAINEKAELKVISERGVKSRTLFFKPTILRDEFTIENLNSGKYDRFFSALPDGNELTEKENMNMLIDGDVKFD